MESNRKRLKVSRPRELWVVLGNPLRGDDGVAYRVVDLARPPIDQVSVRYLRELVPEVAAEIAHFENVVFIDASVSDDDSPSLQPVTPGLQRSLASLSHALSAEALVAVARRLFGFHGNAQICSVPCREFGNQPVLSAAAERNAEQAAGLLRARFAARSA